MAEERKSSGFDRLVAVFIAMLFAVIVYSAIFGEPPAEVPTDAKSIANTHGWTACRDEVKLRLKSPSTADFPWGPDKVVDIGEDRFMVLGHVDAQNGFGAMIRSNFSCRVGVNAAARTYSIDEVNMN